MSIFDRLKPLARHEYRVRGQIRSLLCPLCGVQMSRYTEGTSKCYECDYMFVDNYEGRGVLCPYCSKRIMLHPSRKGTIECSSCNYTFVPRGAHEGQPNRGDESTRRTSGNARRSNSQRSSDHCGSDPWDSELRDSTRQPTYQKDPLIPYYEVLGCSPTASMKEVTSKYRELTIKFHPDNFFSKDLPPEMIAFAERKLIEVREAYSKIKAVKG